MDKWFEDKFKVNRSSYNIVKKPIYIRRSHLPNTTITFWLVVINTVIFLGILLMIPLFGVDFIQQLLHYLALQPESFFRSLYLWTPFTSMFLHDFSSLIHISVNMIALMSIGTFVERLIGRKRFLWFYLLSGIFAGLFFAFVSFFLGNTSLGKILFIEPPTAYAIGASGAIFALAGLLMILTPNLTVLVFFVIPMKLWKGILFTLIALWLVTITAKAPIGNTAHLGGLLIGIAYGLYLKRKYKRKIALIQNMFT